MMPRLAVRDVPNVKQKKIANRFSANVRLEREAAGLTQADLANRSLLSQKHIADIEQGKSGNPTLESICQVAKGLGVKDPLDLLC